MLPQIKRIFKILIPVSLLLIGVFTVPVKIFDIDFSKIMGDMGDARFNNYVLEHGYQYLIGNVKSFWNAPMLYPAKNVIAFSDNLLGTMPIYSLFRYLGIDRETSFQYWIICMFSLNFTFCFWAFYKWSSDIIISAVAAYIFAFGIYNIGHFEHVQVFPKFIAPFVVFWFWKYLNEKKIKNLFFSCIGLVFQFYCGMYLGFFLLYSLLFLFISYLIVYKDWGIFYQLKELKTTLLIASIFLFSLILLSFLILPYLEITNITGKRDLGVIMSTIPRPVSYFFTHIAASKWQILSQHSQFAFEEWWSHFHFTGFLPWFGIIISFLLLFLKKLKQIDKKLITFLLITLILNIVFCLNIGGFSLYKFTYLLPGFSSMRALDRILNIQIIFFLLIFVIAFVQLIRIKPNLKWFTIILPVVVVIDNEINTNELKRFSKAEAQKDVLYIQEILQKKYDPKYKAIAYMPITTKPQEPDIHKKTIELQISTILAAQALNIPIVNAYTGHYPENYMNFFDHMNEEALYLWCHTSGCNIDDIQKINDL